MEKMWNIPHIKVFQNKTQITEYWNEVIVMEDTCFISTHLHGGNKQGSTFFKQSNGLYLLLISCFIYNVDVNLL